MFRACTAVSLVAVCLAGTVPGAAGAAAIDGQVDKVIDGDSVIFRPGGGARPLEVRLQGIDAPEGCQAGGEDARDYLASFVLGKPATLQTRGRDAYGRTLGVLTVNGMVVNQRLVAEGHAWSLRTRWNQGPYVTQEKVAVALKRGLHAVPGAVPPWEFRRSHGPCGGAAAGDNPRAPAAARSPSPPPAAVAATTRAAAPVAGGVGFRCDGRTHCSQMRSCDEARYFLAHCPGVKMDGNRDGVPCERQWCGGPGR